MESWYRVAQPGGQAQYGWGDEMEADAWASMLNARKHLTTNLYTAQLIEDAAEITRLDDGNEGVNLYDELTGDY